MQVTLTFDTDQPTAARIYQLLATAQQAQLVQVSPTPTLPAGDPTPSADIAKANRQKSAAAARAAKAAKDNGPVEQVLGPNGEDQAGDQDEDMGLSPPAASMSPGEAHDAALALVREAYSAGHVAAVKSLQKELKIAKFYDIPVAEGHALYARVMKLAQSVGIRQ
jgi:hypothetical protein